MKAPTIDQIAAMIAGVIASAKIIYDWHRSIHANDPDLSAECRKEANGRIVIVLRAVRLPTQDYFVRRIRARGFFFETTAGPLSEFRPDRLVKSQALPSPTRSGGTLSFEFWELPLDQSSSVRQMAEIQVSVARTARRSRERWKTITVKMTD